MAGNYYIIHKNNTAGKVRISGAMLEPGLIVSATYKKKDNSLKPYYLLIINPGIGSPKLVHAIKLNVIRPNDLFNFASVTGITNAKVKPKLMRLNIPVIDIPETEIKPFHDKYIAPLLNSTFDGAYRVFKLSRFLVLDAINYKWPANLL